MPRLSASTRYNALPESAIWESIEPSKDVKMEVAHRAGGRASHGDANSPGTYLRFLLDHTVIRIEGEIFPSLRRPSLLKFPSDVKRSGTDLHRTAGKRGVRIGDLKDLRNSQ